MSKSKPPVAKILIDLDEYQQLLKLKERVKVQEEELAKHYENKKVNEVNEPAPILNDSIAPAEEKLGAGQQPPVDFSHFMQLLEAKYNLKPNTESFSSPLPVSSSATTQSGAGADDLIESTPTQQTEFQDPEGEAKTFEHNKPVESVNIQKSNLSNNFYDKELLRNIPEAHLSRAEKLLSELKNHPNDLSWDSAGVVYVNQQSLPESDIKYLFPRLFRKLAHPDKIIHLHEIANKIASLGFGSLINRNLTAGTSRIKPMTNHDEMTHKIAQYQHWWYLGDH